MRSRTFPKENQKKLNETIRDLKAENRRLQKELSFMKREVENLVKPVRTRKEINEPQKLEPGSPAWRADFIKRFKKEVLNE